MSKIKEQIISNEKEFDKKRFQTILGGFCWYQDGGNGGYSYDDVEKYVQQHFQSSQKKLLQAVVDELIKEIDVFSDEEQELIDDVIEHIRKEII